MKIFVVFAVINLIQMQPIPDLVKVRRLDEANNAEFYALDTVGLIEKWGYPAEQHNVTTIDGYVLNVFRIPWGINSVNKTQKRPIIILQTVLGGSSDNWVMFGPNRSLAMQLADQGYDVWLGNYRGSTYGRTNIKLSTGQKKFWDFSYHEIGTIDLPNTIDYIINVTNQSSMIYIGHSMGSTSVFILLSEKPEYNKKIRLLISFTPVGIWKKKTILRSLISSIYHLVQNFIDRNGDFELIPQTSTAPGFVKRVCLPNNLAELCLLPLEFFSGEESSQFQKKEILHVLTYLPAGTSAKTVYHYMQAIESGKFAQYDYDYNDNMQRYNQKEPPEYNLKNVTTPILVFYGRNDPLSTREDIEETMKRIGSKTIIEAVNLREFTHGDFFLAKDVKKLLNDRVIERIFQYENNLIK